MSDRDPMTKVIYQAAFDRHVLIDSTTCEAIAAEARAFIGDEIAVRTKDWENPSNPIPVGEDETVGYLMGMEYAESIARGDTK